MKHILKKIFKYITLIFSGLIVICVLFLLFLQTQSAKEHLASWAGRLLSTEALKIEIRGIKDLLPWQLSLKELSISDARGKWLVLQEPVLSWQPGELLQGRLQIKELSLKKAVLLRSPKFPATKKKTREKTDSFSLPEKLPPINVQDFEISEIVIHKAFCRQEGHFFLGGSILLADEHSPGFEIDFKRIDKQGLKLNCRADWLKNQEELKFDLEFAEPDSGFLHACLDLPFSNSFSLSLKGQGPASDWQGDLGLYQNGTELMSSKLGVIFKDKLRVRGSGQVFARDLFVQPYKELMAKAGNFGFDLLLDLQKSSCRINQVWLQNFANKLKIQGLLDLAQKQVQADTELDIPDLGFLKPLISEDLKGKARMSTGLNGTFSSVEILNDIEFKDLALEDLQVEELKIKAGIRPLTNLQTSFKGLQISSNASIAGLKENKVPVFEKPLNIDCLAKLDFQGPLEIVKAKLVLPGQEASFKGALENNGTFQGQLGLQVKQLAPYFKNLLAGISARCNLKADIKGNLDKKQAVLAARGTFSDVSNMPELAQILLKDENQLEVQADFLDWESINIQRLKLNSNAYDLQVKGQMGLSKGLLDFNWQGKGPELSTIAPALHKELQGKSITHQGSIKGHFSDFRAETRLKIDDFSAPAFALKPTQFISALSLQYRPELLKGQGQLAFQSDKAKLEISAELLKQAEALEIRDINVSAPESSVQGNLKLGIRDRFPVLRLKGQINSLAWANKFMEYTLPLGKLDFSLKTENKEQKTAIDLNLRGQDLSYLESKLNSLQIKAKTQFAEINDLRTWTGTTDIEVKEAEKDDLYLEQVQMQSSGSLDNLGFTLDLEGNIQQELQLGLKGSAQLRQKGRDMALSFEKIKGKWARLPFELQDRAELQIGPKRFVLNKSSFSLGQGSLKLACNFLQEQGVDAWVELDDLEFENFFPAQDVFLQAKLKSKASLQGRLDQPVIEADLTAFDILPVQVSDDSLRPGSLHLRAAYKKNKLQGNLDAQFQKKDNIKAQLSMPGSISLKPFDISELTNSNIQGWGKGKLDIKSLTRMLPLTGQEFEGVLDLDLGLEGTISDLLWSGNLSLVDGSYDNFASGTVLRDILARIELDQYDIDIKEIKATDGEDGQISARGRIYLNKAKKLSYDLSTEFDHVSLVRLDSVNADISGELDMTGSLASARLKGDLSVSPAELRIPEPGPRGMQGLEVVEANATSSVAENMAQDQNQTSFLHELGLCIKVRAPAAVYVRGRGLESEWAGELNVNGTAGLPVITGDLELVRGNFQFLGKRFDLEKGQVIFQGQNPPEPMLQIRAVHSAADLKVILEVSGLPSNLEFDLDSNPSYPSGEILSRLLFRRSVHEITPLQAVKLALAVRSLTKGGPSLMDKTRGFLGVDQLEIRQESEEDGTVLGVGKYLNENIYFEVEKGMAEDSGRVQVEIEMTPNISLQSEMGMENQGLEFKWKYSY